MHKEYNHCGGPISKMLSYNDVPFMVSLSTEAVAGCPEDTSCCHDKRGNLYLR
jgi:hypothetical protein